MVPESGRFNTAYMQFTVTEPDDCHSVERPPHSANWSGPLRRLLREWFEFERLLGTVPIVRRLDLGTFTREDYQRLLLNLGLSLEGSRWISRCASSFDRDHADIRSIILQHAHDEHRDYEVLEQDFVALVATWNHSRTR